MHVKKGAACVDVKRKIKLSNEVAKGETPLSNKKFESSLAFSSQSVHSSNQSVNRRFNQSWLFHSVNRMCRLIQLMMFRQSTQVIRQLVSVQQIEQEKLIFQPVYGCKC